MKKAIVGFVALMGFGLLIGGNEAGDAKPKYTIKQVMAKAMKGKGYQKLEKDEQIDLFRHSFDSLPLPSALASALSCRPRSAAQNSL